MAGRRSIRILLYHRFPAAARSSLEVQCAHIKKHYRLISLDDIACWLQGDISLPHNSLAVTVDDGYRDFYLNAYPVFASYQIPVTIFLTTDFLDHRNWLWVDRVRYMCSRTQVRSARISSDSGQFHEFFFQMSTAREQATVAIKEIAKAMSNPQRLRFVMDELPRILKVTVPDQVTTDFEPLKWDEVREMASTCISFGAHTKSHPILSSLRSSVTLLEEIGGSKLRLESELDRSVLHFSYPNGMANDIDPDVVASVKNSGFKTAVVAQGGVNTRHTDRFLLRRNTVAPESGELEFGRFATGFRRH